MEGGRGGEGRQVQGREAPRHEPPRGDAHHARPHQEQTPSKRRHGHHDDDDDDDDDVAEIDPELRYSFQRNFQVFSIDTVVKPLPPAMHTMFLAICTFSFASSHSFGILRGLPVRRSHLD
uniref:Uncharacterized protein n=1 Tax=Ananas comosus var. bracteatus TaxID=296719 RepID=A0A6V7Q7K2_ANACO|nr:unnamed protein product [Ananas comosus var. bracteatus]